MALAWRSFVLLLALGFFFLSCARFGFDADVDADAGVDAGDEVDCSDLDDDGYLPEGCQSEFPADCDDSTALLSPGVAEVCGNGIDEDCSGADLNCGEEMLAVEIENSADTWTVKGPTFQVGFDQSSSGGIVDLRATKASNQNLLYVGFEKYERLSGISHFENWFSWNPDQAPSFRVLFSGPAVVQIEQDWADDSMSGSSRHTIYPDGRILRYERVHLAEALHGWFLAYLAIDIDRWDVVVFEVGGIPGQYLKHGGASEISRIYEGNAEDVGYFCAVDSIQHDVVGWTHHEAGEIFPYGFRVWETGQGSSVMHSLLLSSEWHRGEISPVGDYLGHIMTFVAGTGICDEFATLAGQYASPLRLSLGAGEFITDAFGDDDNDGFNEASGAYELSGLGGRELRLSVDAPGGLALGVFHIKNFDFLHLPVVTLGSERLGRGRDYRLQIADGGLDAWLVMGRHIAQGSTLRIHAP